VAPGHTEKIKIDAAGALPLEYSKMNFSFLQLRFISASNNQAADSLVHIKKNGDDRYVWIFRAPEGSGGNRITDVMVISRAEVLANLKTFVILHEFDSDPFESMQILAPGFPSVLIRMNKVALAFTAITNFMNIVFENWPQTTSYADAVKYVDNDNAGDLLCSRPLAVEDEDEDEDEEGETEAEAEAEYFAAAAECQTRCAEGGPHCECNPNEPPQNERGNHLGRYFINGVAYVPENVDDEMPPLVAFNHNEPSHTTPQRANREDYVPHCPGAPPRVHRTTTMTRNGPRVHTYFS